MNRNNDLNTTICIQDTECPAEIQYDYDPEDGSIEITSFKAFFPVKVKTINSNHSHPLYKTTVLNTVEKEIDLLDADYSFLINYDYQKDIERECLMHYHDTKEEMEKEFWAQICEAR